MSDTKGGEVVRYPVFRDQLGNRFVFPSVRTDREKNVSWTYCLQLCVALNVSQENVQFAAVTDDEGFLNFPRIVADAGSRGFFHGRATVWLIGGPEFDTIDAAQRAMG